MSSKTKTNTKVSTKPSTTKNLTSATPQLTSIERFDVNRIVFSDPIVCSIPDPDPTKAPLLYRRIPISVLYPDGTVGDLILPTTRVFSFGLSVNLSRETGKPNGHVFPLCLWDRRNPSVEEKAWTNTFNEIVEHCKNHLMSVKEEVEQYDLNVAELKKFNPLYWQREKGQIVEGTGPTLYAKIIESKKENKIKSLFFDLDGKSIDPLSLLKKYCYTTAAVKIESIYVGTKISLQVKLYEATVELTEGGMKSLLPRPKSNTRVLLGSSTNMNDMKDDDFQPSVENDDIVDEDDDIKAEGPPTPKAEITTVVKEKVKVPTKRNVTKVAK